MAVRKLVGTGGKDFPPEVDMKKTPGSIFKGKLLAVREVKTMNGPKKSFTFAVIDSTAPIGKAEKTGQVTPEGKNVYAWREADVAAGAEVDIFAPPTMLRTQLEQAMIGEVVEITFKGRGQAKPGKKPAYIYEVLAGMES